MVPQTLILRNFMCYREDVPELPFDGINIACLSGENGAGKSAMLDAITWVLWGKARMSDEELLAVGSNEMEVDLCFALGGQEYRVIRKYQRGSGKRGGKGSLDLQVRNGTGWKPLGELQKVQTQEHIIDLLRMKYDTFINSAFLLQGRADEFTRKAPGERKQVLADILDLSEYARLEQKAKDRAKELEGKVKGLDGRIEQLRLDAAKGEVYRQARDEAHERVEELGAALERASERRERAEGRVRELHDAQRQQREQQIRAEKLRAEQAEAEGRRGQLQEAIAAAAATLGRKGEIEAGVEALAAARAELAHLDGLRDRFDALEGQKRELKELLLEERDRLRAALVQAQGELARLQGRAARRAGLVAEIGSLEGRVRELEPLAVQRETLGRGRDAIEARLSDFHRLNLRREQLLKQIEKRQDSLVATREEKGRLVRRLDGQLAEEPRLRRDLEEAREQGALLVQEREQLVGLRAEEQRGADLVIDLRSRCQSIKAQADSLKERQGLLAADDASCPVCGSDLGHEGVAQVRAHYDEELQRLRAEYGACKKDADGGERQLKATRGQITALEGQIASRVQAAALADDLALRLGQLEEVRRERAEVAADLESVVALIAAKEFDPAAQEELHGVEAHLREVGSGAELEAERRALDEQVRALEAKLREQGKLEGTLAQQRQELAAIEGELLGLPDAEARAVELAATLERNEFAPEVRARGKVVETELRELGYSREAEKAARALVGELVHWEDEQRHLAGASQQIELNRFRLQDLDGAVAARQGEIDLLNGQLAALAATVQSLRDAPGEREQAGLEEAKYKRELLVAQRILGENESLLKTAIEAAAQLLERENERKGLLERLGVFEELAAAYGKKGLQAMLIETAIPEIEREANGLLGRMTDNQMHVTVETQRETRKGDAQETLEIKIADALGTRAYDAFSGGESFRVNFAIRIALSKLLARRAGARLETLVIDEGFGALDTKGRERLVEAISSVQHDFKRILVITHIQELKDLFPTQIEVTKTPEGSRWQLV